MKETKIAKENVELYIENDEADVCKINPISHKQTCQRWLRFLDKIEIWTDVKQKNAEQVNNIEIKIEDLKQAIKLYDEAGI